MILLGNHNSNNVNCYLLLSMAGRKRKEIDNEIVTTLRERQISWKDIASHPQVNVCRSTHTQFWEAIYLFVKRTDVAAENY